MQGRSESAVRASQSTALCSASVRFSPVCVMPTPTSRWYQRGGEGRVTVRGLPALTSAGDGHRGFVVDARLIKRLSVCGKSFAAFAVERKRVFTAVRSCADRL